MYLLNRVPSKAVPKTLFKLWIGRKPSLRHLHVQGCQAEIRFYNPQENKLDSRTISGCFIGYLEKSTHYRFYCPNHTTKIIKTGNARFIENGEVSRSEIQRKVENQKMRVQIPLTCTSSKVVVPQVVERINNHEEQQINDPIPTKRLKQMSL